MGRNAKISVYLSSYFILTFIPNGGKVTVEPKNGPVGGSAESIQKSAGNPGFCRRKDMKDAHQRNTILLSGYAKLPASTTAEAVFDILVVAVLFDNRTGTIVEAEASMVTELAKRFISNLMVGYNLNDGPEDLIESFDTYYHGNAKKALETAIRGIFNKYRDYVTEQNALL